MNEFMDIISFPIPENENNYLDEEERISEGPNEEE